MSMPNIPDINPDICLNLEDVMKLLLYSIALQEIALSNIINAESEKLQYIVKRNENCYSIKELTSLNVSIEKVLYEVCSIETLLISKLKYVNQMYNDNGCCECFDKCEEENNNCKCTECCNIECVCNDQCNNKYNGNYNNMNDYFNKAYNQNNYYKNYNKISDMVNKIITKTSNKFN